MNRVTVPWSLGNGWRLLKSGYGTVLKAVTLPNLVLFAPLAIITYIISTKIGLPSPAFSSSAEVSVGKYVVSMAITFIASYGSVIISQLMTIGILFSLYDWIKNKNKKPRFSQAFQAFTRPIFGRVIPYVLLSSLIIVIISMPMTILSRAVAGNQVLSILVFFLSIIGSLFTLQLRIVLYGAYFLIKSDLNKKSKSKGRYLSGAWNKLAGNKWRAFGGGVIAGVIFYIVLRILAELYRLLILPSLLSILFTGSADFTGPIIYWIVCLVLILLFALLITPWLTSAIASFYSKAIPAKK